MNNRSLVYLFSVILLLWIICGTYCWVCKFKGHCDGKVKTEKPVEQNLSIPGLSIKDGTSLNISHPSNIYFDYKGSQLTVGDDLTGSFNQLATYLKDNPDKNLVLTGKYLGEEGGSDLGLARANEFRKYLSDNFGIDTTRIKTSFKQVDNLVVDNDLGRTYGAIDFAFNTDRSKSDGDGDNEEAELDKLRDELAKVRTVYFDHGSSNMKTDPKLHQFFTDLKYYIGKRPDAKASLVGHTDDSGSNATNQRLSVARCRDVADFLKQNHGYANGNFVQRGMGETKPIASNSTEDGKAKNRRVEISLKH